MTLGTASRPRRALLGLAVLLVVALALVVLRLIVYRGLDGRLEWGWPDASVARFRWTAVAVAAIVGSALGVSGVLLQALLRNPLASPFVLGISGGAALGVMTAMYLAWALDRPGLRAGSGELPALLGALATLAVVYLLGQRRGWLDPLSLVLAGIVISSICGALIMFLQHLSPHGLRGDIVTWMMGTIRQGVPASRLAVAGGLTAAFVVLSALLGRAMDAATLDDDEARSVGVSIGGLRTVLFLAAGALAALAVALTGPIGFVGLVAPHAARLCLGPRHAVLVVGTVLLGTALLVGGDVVTQVAPLGGGRMPVGVFTTLLGGVTFLWLLRSGRGQA